MSSNFKMIAFRDQKKVGPRPDGSPFMGLIQNFRRTSFHMGVPSRDTILVCAAPWGIIFAPLRSKNGV